MLFGWLTAYSKFQVGDKRRNGKEIGDRKEISTIQVYHGAIIHWYDDIQKRPPGNFDHNWSEFVKGAKKEKAKLIQTGKKIKGGADKLDMLQYMMLTDTAIDSRHFFVAVYLVLAWNLMTRVSNTFGVLYEHISLSGDHLVINVNRHKGDTEGCKPGSDKACYANPENYKTCIMTLLGLSLVCKSSYHERDFIFECNGSAGSEAGMKYNIVYNMINMSIVVNILTILLIL